MVSQSPIVTAMTVITVAGRDSMLLNLSGAHGPFFTRNIVVMEDSSGHRGVGEVPIVPPGAALANAIDAPYACRAGVCSTCRCKVIEGEAEMRTNHALEDYEVARGYVLSCQAVPRGGRVAVDYDQ